jgi:uncharacterized protein with FMN-binding domain
MLRNMKRGLTLALSALTLALPIVQQAAAARTTVRGAKTKTVTQKLSGQMYQADRWGSVQVVVTLKKTTSGSGKASIKYTDLGGQYTYHTSRSQYIMSQALPMLRQEFLQSQSARVQNISGATYTSQAFQQSLQSALLKAGK